MAVKKILQENNRQIWPITRIDCVFTKDNQQVLSTDFVTKEEINERFISDKDVNDILFELFNVSMNIQYNREEEELTSRDFIYNEPEEEIIIIADTINYDNDELKLK